MRGIRIVAKTKKGSEWIKELYDRPKRKDRMLANTSKVLDDPLTYNVLFKNKGIIKVVSARPDDFVYANYRGIEKHTKTSIPEVKKHVRIDVI